MNRNGWRQPKQQEVGAETAFPAFLFGVPHTTASKLLRTYYDWILFFYGIVEWLGLTCTMHEYGGWLPGTKRIIFRVLVTLVCGSVLFLISLMPSRDSCSEPFQELGKRFGSVWCSSSLTFGMYFTAGRGCCSIRCWYNARIIQFLRVLPWLCPFTLVRCLTKYQLPVTRHARAPIPQHTKHARSLQTHWINYVIIFFYILDFCSLNVTRVAGRMRTAHRKNRIRIETGCVILWTFCICYSFFSCLLSFLFRTVSNANALTQPVHFVRARNRHRFQVATTTTTNKLINILHFDSRNLHSYRSYWRCFQFILMWN